MPRQLHATESFNIFKGLSSSAKHFNRIGKGWVRNDNQVRNRVILKGGRRYIYNRHIEIIWP